MYDDGSTEPPDLFQVSIHNPPYPDGSYAEVPYVMAQGETLGQTLATAIRNSGNPRLCEIIAVLVDTLREELEPINEEFEGPINDLIDAADDIKRLWEEHDCR